MSKKPTPATVNTMNTELFDQAVEAGKAIIADGKPKMNAAMSIYVALLGEPQETIVSAFIEGAALTPKGAVTYWYNCRRKHTRSKSSPTA